MKTQEPHLVRILVEWSPFNYGRADGDPVFLKEGDVVEFARVTPKCYIVNYGDGRVRKQLKRFSRRYMQGERKSWREVYGSHDRASYTLLNFTLLP